MKCYNHHDRDAFGICKSCGKALCLECMNTEASDVICKNDLKCLHRYNQAESMMNNVEKMYSKTNVRRSIIIAVLFILLGTPFGIISIFSHDIIYAFFALLFISCGIIVFKRAKETQICAK